MIFAEDFLHVFKSDGLSTATIFDTHTVHIYGCDNHIAWIIRYHPKEGMVHVVHRPRKFVSVTVATFNPNYVNIKNIAAFVLSY